MIDSQVVKFLILKPAKGGQMNNSQAYTYVCIYIYIHISLSIFIFLIQKLSRSYHSNIYIYICCEVRYWTNSTPFES